MKINCYQFSEGPQVVPCDYSFAVDTVRHKKGKIWIDLLDADTSELEKTLDDLNVQGLIRQFCLESRDHPGYYPLKPIALMVMPVQMEEQDSNTMEYLAVVFSSEFVLTIRNGKMARFRKSISSEDSLDLLPDESTAGIISTLLMGLSLDCLRKAARLSDVILDLEERRERDPEKVNIEEISAKRSELLTLESIVKGQLPIIDTIISSDRPAKIQESSLDYLRWASANLISADKKLEWLERRLEVMRSLIDMHAQERTNRRLGRLTVLSMIFMPVTFLAGIWGMNFKSMPLISFEHGYIIALIIMLIITGGTYFYFHRKGWFG
jgi:magnesium transporter